VRGRREPKNLGQLHATLRRGLPDYVQDDLLKVKGDDGLAKQFGVTWQCVYIWFADNRLPARRVKLAIELSENTREENRDNGFRPLSWADLEPFVNV
jgi:hypothetical protein